MPRVHALVVDDSAAMRRQLAYALERIEGMSTVEAGDGADAWRKPCSAAFDVILTDIHMPLLDGLKLVAMVRSGGVHRTVPIVVVTTESAEADRRRALSLGASAYLVKPVQAGQVVTAVKVLLRIE